MPRSFYVVLPVVVRPNHEGALSEPYNYDTEIEIEVMAESREGAARKVAQALTLAARLILRPGNILDIESNDTTDDGLERATREPDLEALAHRFIDEFPEQARAYQGGADGLLGFLVGKVMTEARGAANPHRVADVFTRLLRSWPRSTGHDWKMVEPGPPGHGPPGHDPPWGDWWSCPRCGAGTRSATPPPADKLVFEGTLTCEQYRQHPCCTLKRVQADSE